MNDVAAEIGLTKPAVYRSLGDKAQLSAALAERVAVRLADQIAATLDETGELRATVGAAIDVFCRFVDEDTNLYRFVLHGSLGTRPAGMDKPLVTRLARQIGDSLSTALDQAGADPELAETWAYAILGAVFVATEHWLRHRRMSRAQLVEHLVQMVVPALEDAGVGPVVHP